MSQLKMNIKSTSTARQEDIEDPVEEMLKRTGCMELHYQVQVLIFWVPLRNLLEFS